MATQTNPDGFTYDPVTGTPVDKATADNAAARKRETDALSGKAVGDAAQALQTANAYAGQIAQANTTAGEAKAIAQGAESVVRDELQPQVDALNTAAGYAPGDATDAAMANVGSNPDTQFRAVLNAQMVEYVRGRPLIAPSPNTATVAEVQAGIDEASFSGAPYNFRGGEYNFEGGTILVSSGQTVEGIKGSTMLRQATPGIPVMASKNWKNGAGAAAGGHMTIRNLWFIGEANDPDSHGLVIRDYLSNFENLIASSSGGDGIHMTHLDSAGVAYAGSSMVDNRFLDIDARANKGWGMFLGATDNNKFTDLYMDRVYVSAGAGAPGAIFGGSAGGWHWGKVHTYGQPVPYGIQLYNLNNTNLGELYIEGGNLANLSLNRIQRNVTISSLSARGPAVAGGSAVTLSKSSLVDTASVLIGTMNVMQDNAFAYNGVLLDTSTLDVQIGAMGRDGANRDLIVPVAGSAAEFVALPGNITVTQKVRSSGATITLDGLPLPLTNRAQWAGSGAKTVTLPIPDLRTGGIAHGTISVVGVRNYNGSHNQKWRADLVLTSKFSADAWSAYTTNIIAPVGFTVNPTVTVNKADRTITVAFTPSDADAYGAVSYALEWA